MSGNNNQGQPVGVPPLLGSFTQGRNHRSVISAGQSFQPFPTADQLNEVGHKVMTIQTDGKIVIGVLASVDHFGNILLCAAVQRICIGGANGVYGDVPLGSILIRGDSVALTCQLDQHIEKEGMNMTRVPTNEILRLQQEQILKEEEHRSKLLKGLRSRGVRNCQSNDFLDTFED